MKKHFIHLLLLFIVFALVACNDARDVAGTYSGNYTSDGLFFSGGAAKVHLTENGTEKVNVHFESANYDYHIDGVGVKRSGWSNGDTYYDLTYEVFPWNVWGTIYSDGEAVVNIRNDDDDFYIEFIDVN